MLSVENTALVVIDFQERLARVMYEREKLIENVQKLILYCIQDDSDI